MCDQTRMEDLSLVNSIHVSCVKAGSEGTDLMLFLWPCLCTSTLYIKWVHTMSDNRPVGGL